MTLAIKNILLVEDSKLAQIGIKALFQMLHCKVEIANNATEGVALFLPGKYDLIIMDIGLPDGNGYDVTKKIREKEKETGFSVPIIGVSAHALCEKDVQDKARDAGINEMYEKPLLLAQAKSVLVRYGIRKEEDFE